ncbi:hypothetical protein SSBG_05802 [Streptomyces sp. SPB074]|nr:hypothetical protein SSBG_05802 [Streptomyces sp. SPB074]
MPGAYARRPARRVDPSPSLRACRVDPSPSLRACRVPQRPRVVAHGALVARQVPGERGDRLRHALAGAPRVGEREGEHGGQGVAQVVLAVGAFGGQEADGLLRVAERAP